MTTRRKIQHKDMVRITQVHSQIGNQTRIKKVLVDGLGLGRIGASVILPDNGYTRGMVAKCAHIVSLEPIVESPAPRATRARTPKGTKGEVHEAAHAATEEGE